MLGALLASNPKTRDALLGLARRHQLKQENAMEVAALLLNRLVGHAHEIAAGRPSPGPFLHLLDPNGLNVQSHERERRSIRRNRASRTSRQHDAARRNKSHAPHNQRTAATTPKNQTAHTKQRPKPND